MDKRRLITNLSLSAVGAVAPWVAKPVQTRPRTALLRRLSVAVVLASLAVVHEVHAKPPPCQNGKTRTCFVGGQAGTQRCSEGEWGDCTVLPACFTDMKGSLTATPQTISLGESVTLHWNVNVNVPSECTVSLGGTEVARTDSLTVQPPTAGPRSYRLNVTFEGRKRELASAPVTVEEPIVRTDYSDPSYGALANSTVRPLGGGADYGQIVPRPATVIHTAAELRKELLIAKNVPYQTIYIDDEAEIDLSYCSQTPTPGDANCQHEPRSNPRDPVTGDSICTNVSLQVPPHTTVASGRGRDGSRGARLFSRTFADCPLFDVTGKGVRITGLRLHGPDSSVENDDPLHCGGEASAIRISPENVGSSRLESEIDNNEISSWPRAGVLIEWAHGVRVHHNVIQYNRRREEDDTCDSNYSFGYGVNVGVSSATIEANVFDHNSHHIASDPRPGSYYAATYNLVLTGAAGHSFDVHGTNEGPGGPTNTAGSAFVIHHNTFLHTSEPAVKVRGIPLEGAWIYRNETRHNTEGEAFVQSNSSGRFWVEDNRTRVNYFPAWFVSFDGAPFWQWQQFDGTATTALAAGDFDGDGAADVMRATATGWQWSKSGREGWAFLNTLKQPVSQLRFGDFVGLGFTDVVRATGSEWQVSEGGTAPSWRRLYPTTAPLTNAAFGDFEGDGHTDAFFADGTQWTIVESFSPPVRRHYTQPYTLAELRFGNFVGDAKVDVVRSTGSEWLVWDHGSRMWNHLNFSSIPLSQLTFADFDGDGFTDIARNDGQWFVSWGGQSKWKVLNPQSALDLRSLLIADFNGDGKADVLSRQSPKP